MKFAIKNDFYLDRSKTLFKNKESGEYIDTSVIKNFKLYQRTNRPIL